MFLGDDIMNVPFKRGNILLPKNADMSKVKDLFHGTGS